MLVSLPVRASWLNQVEIYFSVIQRKVLAPNDFADLAEVESRLLAFERRYEQTADPFECEVHPRGPGQADATSGRQGRLQGRRQRCRRYVRGIPVPRTEYGHRY